MVGPSGRSDIWTAIRSHRRSPAHGARLDRRLSGQHVTSRPLPRIIVVHPRYSAISMPTVELVKVHKTYDHFVAVNDLSFQIQEGEVFGLLGPNGAGKTSTIRMMIGIMVPDSGEVNVFGKPFSRQTLQRIGYLPDERGLYQKMKILDHLIFLGRMHGLETAEARRRAQAW